MAEKEWDIVGNEQNVGLWQEPLYQEVMGDPCVAKLWLRREWHDMKLHSNYSDVWALKWNKIQYKSTDISVYHGQQYYS